MERTISQAIDERTPLEAAIDTAFEYAYPVHEIMRTRHQDVHAAPAAQCIAPNAAWHDRRLCDDRSRWITTPNNDTLYSRAWIDLGAGPIRVEVGAMPAGRYWSVAFLDAYSNNFAMLGQRLDGCGPVAVTLVGPDEDVRGIEGRVIRAPGLDVWLFGRWLVDGPDDLPAAYAMQDALRVTPTGGAPMGPRAVPGGAQDPAAFLAVVNEALGRNPPPAADAPLLARCAPVGLRPGEPDAWASLDATVREAWEARIGSAQAAVRKSLGVLREVVDGWIVRAPEIGNFGTNYALRAAIALGGLAALEPAEAVYASRSLDEAGERFDGRQRYRLTLPAAGLPTDSFWSLSMYEATREGQLFFTANPVGRYAIGDRTPGLRRAADGTLEIAIQHDEPVDPVQRANWLPAPAGPFVLTLRAYLPRPELRDWRVPLPRVSRIIG